MGVKVEFIPRDILLRDKLKKIRYRVISSEDATLLTINREPVAVRITAETIDVVRKNLGWKEKEVLYKDYIQVEYDFALGEYLIILGPRLLDIIEEYIFPPREKKEKANG